MVGGRIFNRELARAGIISRSFLRSQEEEDKFCGMCLLLASGNAMPCHAYMEILKKHNLVSHYFLTDLNQLFKVVVGGS